MTHSVFDLQPQLGLLLALVQALQNLLRLGEVGVLRVPVRAARGRHILVVVGDRLALQVASPLILERKVALDCPSDVHVAET